MSANSLNVLIVDDEEDIVEWLTENIEWEVYNCEIVGGAVSAQEALCLMEERTVDILLTDICMPNMTGLELIKEVKERYPGILVIVISAYDRFSYVKEAYQYGIVDYCLKPIDVNELQDCIKTACSFYEERLITNLQQDKRIFRNSIFQRLLNGDINSFRMEEQCELAGIEIEEYCWQIAMIDIYRLERSKGLLVLERFKKGEMGEYYCFLDSYMNLVFLFYGKEECDKEQMIIEQIRRELGEVKTFLSIGGVLGNYKQIAESYQICRAFLNAGALFIHDCIKSDIYPYEKYLDFVRSRDLWKIVNCCKADDSGGMIQFITKVVKKNTSEPEKMAELVCMAVFLFCQFDFAFRREDIFIPEQKVDEQTTSEMLLNWVQDFCKVNVSKRETENRFFHPYVKLALQKIHFHYADDLLSLQEIAKTCNISSAYLGKMFKEQTGEFFCEYLLNVRLSEALILLEDKRLNVGKIAAAVGFTNQSYFNKMFRRRYRMSPMEYRKSFCKESEDYERKNISKILY